MKEIFLRTKLLTGFVLRLQRRPAADGSVLRQVNRVVSLILS